MPYKRYIGNSAKLCWFKKGDTAAQTRKNIQQGIVENVMVLVVGGSGSGKSVFANVASVDIAESSDRTIIYITEKKTEELANAFHVFEPEMEYHLRLLQLQKQNKKTHLAKIYHPCTLFANSKGQPYKLKIPEINWYAYPVKALSEFFFRSILATDSEIAIDTCLDICNDLSDEATLWDFLHILNQRINEESEVVDKLTLLTEQSAGDKRTVRNVSMAFKNFFDDYFLHPNNSPYLLDFVKLCNDSEHIHHFTSKWINSNVRKAVNIIEILVNIDKALASGKVKKQLVLVLEEIKILFPPKNIPRYLQQLVNLIWELLTRIRTKAMVIATSQSIFSLDPEIITSFQAIFIGKIDKNDYRRLRKDYGFTENELVRIRKLKTGEFVWWETEDNSEEKIGATFKVDVPTFANHEQGQDFFSKFLETFPEKCSTNTQFYKEFKAYRNDHYKRRKEANAKLREQKKKDQEIKEARKDKAQPEVLEKVKQLKQEKRTMIMKNVYERVMMHAVIKEGVVSFEKGWSWSRIARNVGGIKHHKTAEKYFYEHLSSLGRKDRPGEEPVVPGMLKDNPNKVGGGGKYA